MRMRKEGKKEKEMKKNTKKIKKSKRNGEERMKLEEEGCTKYMGRKKERQKKVKGNTR
jgi:hypothetical protein